MTTLLVHPSRGKADGRINWDRSLGRPVDFLQGPLASTLTSSQTAALRRRHPDGLARFWGTYGYNEAKISRVHEGDVVLFTGQGGAWAVGTIGYRFENAAFARTLWVETQGKGSYQHIYSLARYREVTIPYAAMNEPLGHKLTNHFQQIAVYDDYRAQAAIEALRLDVVQQEDVFYETADAALADLLTSELEDEARLVPIETVGTISTIAHVTGGDRLVQRGESSLVQAYAASLPADAKHGRHFTSAGVTDLYVKDARGGELIEAKSVETHLYVRQALAQLLDYAPTITPSPTSVSALFARRPADRGIGLMHRYGINCIYRSGPSTYRRLTAPPEATERLLSAFTRP
jgi:hypothetical protein